MRYLFLLCLFCWLGCPGSPSVDSVSDAGVTSSGNVFDVADAGTGTSPENSQDDAGQPVNIEPAVDAGTFEPEPEVTCGTQNSATLSLSWADDNLLPRLNVSTAEGLEAHAIGQANRSGMGDVFQGSPRTDPNLPYRWICDDHGLTFDFIDTPDSNNLLDTIANGSDTLSRIVVDVSSSLVFLGQVVSSLQPTALMTAVGNATYYVHDYPDTLQMVVFPEKGFSFLLSTEGVTQNVAGTTDILDGTLLSLTFFKPQEDNNWGASFNLTAATITFDSGTISTSQGFTGGSNFGSVISTLGPAYDVNSTIEEDDFKANITTYASLGLRFVEGCGANPIFPIGDPFICSGKVTVLMISSPFMGVDSTNGLRLGSTFAEVETALGEGALRIDEETGGEVYVYGSSSPKTGIIYGYGTDGIQRVAAFILNYIDENELP